MDDEKTDQELLNAIGNNEPLKLPSGGASGSTIPVSREEAEKMRMVLRRLMHTAISDDEIYKMMNKAFGITKEHFFQMRRDLYERMSAEDKDRFPVRKIIQKDRIRKNIGEMEKDRSWAAYTNAEKTLAMIEGNLEPVEVSNPAADRLNDAILRILGQSDPVKTRQLVERGRVLFTTGKIEVLSPSEGE